MYNCACRSTSASATNRWIYIHRSVFMVMCAVACDQLGLLTPLNSATSPVIRPSLATCTLCTRVFATFHARMCTRMQVEHCLTYHCVPSPVIHKSLGHRIHAVCCRARGLAVAAHGQMHTYPQVHLCSFALLRPCSRTPLHLILMCIHI